MNAFTWAASIAPPGFNCSQILSAMIEFSVADTFIVYINESKQSGVNKA